MYDDFASRDGAISVLGTFAIQTHELFLEFKKAGFTDEQAIAIVVGLAQRE